MAQTNHTIPKLIIEYLQVCLDWKISMDFRDCRYSFLFTFATSEKYFNGDTFFS